MAVKGFYKKYENIILASAAMLVLMMAVGIRYDYYYDMNDDVLIKDIMAGVYTGVPEAHNIQILYPLSLAISLLYRIFPKAPVYGIFLCLCQYGSLWLIAERSLHFRSNTVSKILMAGVEGIGAYVLLLSHLVYVQYTFTSALLAAAAAFLFVTMEEGLSTGKFIRKSISCVLLAVLAFLLRSEMLMLLLPMICVAGVYRWSKEKKIFKKENFIRYIGVFGMILAGLLVGTAVNEAAFGNEKWAAYVDYFNSRTELYDFQGIPEYTGNEKLYDRLGITKSEQYMLFEQYNFGLDDTLDASVLDAISEYQAGNRKEEINTADLVIEKARLCIYRMFHREPAGSAASDDYPWNIMVLLGYLAVIITMIWNCAGAEENEKSAAAALRIGKNIWKLIFLLFVRMALWMFILIRGRDPIRITHSLYLMEFIILTAMLHVECAGLEAKVCGRVKATVVFPVVILLTVMLSLSDSISVTDREYEARATANLVDAGMKAYCRAHGDNFYFMDVYSAVSYPFAPYESTFYSEKMFTGVNNGLGNYDIMGGWLSKSPLYEKKIKNFGMDSMQQGIVYHDKVYVMAELEKGTEYMTSYFADQNITVSMELTDTICDIIGVYKIESTE